VQLGFNYRWTDVQAAIGLAQLEKLDEILARRARVAARYSEALASIEGVEVPLADDAGHRRSWFVYVVKLAPELDRDGVMAAPREQGVATAEYVPCIHLQPYMRERYGFGEGLCPAAEETSRRTLALPFATGLEPDDQERVVGSLRAAVTGG
jgi:perosamine synthetase